jgi:putative tryptophan/tyrosine transport system substrate-binding protein
MARTSRRFAKACGPSAIPGPAAAAAKQGTTTTPIVIGAATTEFLMRQNVISSLSRPGGNITGFTISAGVELDGKRLQLLREALPGLGRLVIVWNPSNEGARTSLRALETEARALGVQAQAIEAPNIEELDRRLGGVGRIPGAAMLTLADAFLWSQRARIVSLAARHRLPGMYPEREPRERARAPRLCPGRRASSASGRRERNPVFQPSRASIHG